MSTVSVVTFIPLSECALLMPDQRMAIENMIEDGVLITYNSCGHKATYLQGHGEIKNGVQAMYAAIRSNKAAFSTKQIQIEGYCPQCR